MNLSNWTDTAPTDGTFTVLTVTPYSHGEVEVLATTIKDPSFIKRKKRDIEADHEALLESVALTGDAALLVIEEATEIKEISDLDREENKQRSLRRAKKSVRQRIIEGQLDHFLTLTYKENKQDLKLCWKDWKKFIRLVQDKYPTIKYLVIVERQKRGAVHFHVCVHGFLHANTIRSLWLSVVGEGNIDLQHKQRNQSLHRLALYMTKYLTKQYDELDDFKNLYRCSRNIKIVNLKFYLSKEFAFIRPQMIESAIRSWVKDIKNFWEHANGLFSCQWASSLSP